MFSLWESNKEAHADGAWAVAWSRAEGEAGRRIATGGLDNKLRLWEVGDEPGSLACATTLEGAHQLGVISVDYSPDGRLVASGSTECALKVWDASSGESLTNIDAGPYDSWTTRFSPDGTRLATGSHNGKINIFEVPSGAKATSLETGGKFLLSVAWSPDGRLIAAASQEGIVYVAEVETGSILHTMEAHALPTRCLVFTPDSQILVSASDDRYLKLHDLASTASLVASLPGHTSWVLDVDASPSGKLLASGSSDGCVKVWDMGERRVLHSFKEHQDQVWGVSFAPDSKRLASVSEDSSLNIYSLPV